MKNYLTLLLFLYAIFIVPVVHTLAPMFYAQVPEHVATASGSIIGQTNVYAQLIPYLVAVITAVFAFIYALVRTWKGRSKGVAAVNSSKESK